jgi:hypothetical protein
MNQANQQVVIQSANMNLVQIRTFELNYFTTFFSNFGTQSALMIGFIAGSVSQVPGFDNPTGAPYFWAVEYWVTSALTVGTAIACLISAFFLIVFGQGLAIRGPEGSMIKTIEGMIQEQHYIVILFSLTLFFFALQCMGMYYLMFDSTSAMVTTIITGIAIIIGYREAVRLYNRFSWGRVSTFFDEKNEEDELNDLDPSLVTDLMTRDRRSVKKSIQDFSSKRKSTVKVEGSVNNNDKRGRKGGDGDDELSSQSASDVDSVYSASSNHDIKLVGKSSMYAAYLSMKDRGKLGRERWKRRYFLLRGTHLFYYRDRRNFELNPAKPINKRAIDLEGYTLVAGSSKAPYPIRLLPTEAEDIRKVWKFRCDTESEFHNWVQLLTLALKLANPAKAQNDLVQIQEGKFEVMTVASSEQDQSAADSEGEDADD